MELKHRDPSMDAKKPALRGLLLFDQSNRLDLESGGRESSTFNLYVFVYYSYI